MVPRENKNNAYAKFWRTNKEYYGIFGRDPYIFSSKRWVKELFVLEKKILRREMKSRSENLNSHQSRVVFCCCCRLFVFIVILSITKQ